MCIERVVVNELNNFEVVEFFASNNELEYVLVNKTKENLNRLNLLFCLVEGLDVVDDGEGHNYCHSVYDVIECSEGDVLDLSYAVYNELNIKTDNIGFYKGRWVFCEEGASND